MATTATDSKELIILSLTRFFRLRKNLEVFLAHVDGKGEEKTSLRVIDWFVTNYSKVNNITIIKPNGDHFHVYSSYRSQLKAYTKHQFDPFRRRYRINYYYDCDRFVETTIGQLNFFRWLIDNDILSFIRQHQDEIESDMVSSTQEDLPKKIKNEANNMNQFVGAKVVKFN